MIFTKHGGNLYLNRLKYINYNRTKNKFGTMKGLRNGNY